tara:strand:+ start:655 stop:1008 length:354 start_codon:yes stop_codon:yes gene_type:complete
MGIRSDVGIAIKNDVYDQLPVRTKLFIQEHFSQEDHTEEGEEGGRLFHTSGVKWHLSHSDISNFYEELEKIDEWGDGYLILEGCYEYPESIESDAGNWHDNPWGMYRNVEVSIDWSR